MLDSPLHWFGKLPNHAEFLSSKTNPNLECFFNAWIILGQNHIGKSLITSSRMHSLYAYLFYVHQQQCERLWGLLLTSKDSKGRQYPFIIVDSFENLSIETSLTQVKNCFAQLDFKIMDYYTNFDEIIFYNNLKDALHKIHPQNPLDEWVEFYPMPMQLKLSINGLTPILYRKLMQRGY